MKGEVSIIENGGKMRSEGPNETFANFYRVETSKLNFWRLLSGESGRKKFLEPFTVQRGDLRLTHEWPLQVCRGLVFATDRHANLQGSFIIP